ncbi:MULTISPECIES: FAD-dependent oxidoreductase [Paracoccus]|uniref:NAD(P)/FAD-dependent oxidoreductase n=1 Tax=Paracoccus TaxID=265 RepID=UPI0023F06853|nr:MULTISPECIES: FAD-dependent oxidoreductase [Paracoccus]
MARVIHVAGGGVFGLAAAWALIRRGAQVTVFEAATIGAGSSGGHVGALAPHAPDPWNTKKQLQLDSLLAAPAFWASAEQASGLPTGYARTGRLQPVPDMETAARLPARIEAAARHWPAAMGMTLTRDPQGPLIPPSPTGLWLTDGLTARLNPRAALLALATAIRAGGGQIHEHTPAPDDHAPTLWATGTPGLMALNSALDRRIGQGVKGQSLLLSHAAPDGPQVFADGLHIVPHADGTTAIGSTSENTWDHPGPDDQAQTLLTRATALCPTLAQAPILNIWAGLRPRARSRAPILAPWPGRPGHLIANGGFKIGFGMAPLIADLAAKIMLDDHTDIPDLFTLP